MSDQKNKGQNKRLLELIQTHCGPDYHPIITLANMATNAEKDSDRVAAAKAMMPFLEPQLKAIEVRGQLKNDFGVLRVSLVSEEGEENKESEERED